MTANCSRLRFVASVLVCTLTLGLVPPRLEADNLSNNTVQMLSNNSVSVRDNTFYTPISVANNISVVVQLAGGPWGAVAGAVFSIISSQMAKDDSNKRFEEINQQLQLIRQQLAVMDLKLDRIDLALRQISDKEDEILDAVHDVPARDAFYKVLADISLIQDHWGTWTKTKWGFLTPAAQADMRSAYKDLTKDAAVLYSSGDPSYTAALAMALRLNLDLAVKLNLGRDEIEDLKKGYRRFLDASLQPAQNIKAGELVNRQDSFPTRLAKRKSLIKTYLAAEYSPATIAFATSCRQPLEFQPLEHNPGVSLAVDETAVRDSFVWDPPAENNVLLRLIRTNAVSFVPGPVDHRLYWYQRGFGGAGDPVPVEMGKFNDSNAFTMTGAWDLVAAVRNTGTMFEYVGAYYRPTRLDKCEYLGNIHMYQPRFGVLTSAPSPKTAEEFFKQYGSISDSDVNIYSQEKLVQVNRQLQLMGMEAIAFAATSEFRESLNR